MLTASDDALARRLDEYFGTSSIALCLAQATAEDTPLTLVNDAFCTLTGYPREEVLGRNCRFLQGPETSAAARRALHDYMHDPSRESGRFELMNHRKDGTPFLNVVFMTRLRDRRGETRFILASQFDLTHALGHAPGAEDDRALTEGLEDMRNISAQFGVTLLASAESISESIATIARLHLRDIE